MYFNFISEDDITRKRSQTGSSKLENPIFGIKIADIASERVGPINSFAILS